MSQTLSDFTDDRSSCPIVRQSEGTMSASPIACEVYRAHVEHFGEPDESIVYDDKERNWPGFGPRRIDVLAWLADDQCDVTTFAPIGMGSEPMEGAAHRAEMHFAVRRRLTRAERRQCNLFLVNLAQYPFRYKTHVDWWHRIHGEVPLFPSARAVLFHPRLVPDGWDTIPTDEDEVRLLNAIPLNAQESRLKQIS